MQGGKDKLKGSPHKDKKDLKGDIHIIDLWMQGMDSINDMRVVNKDTHFYLSKTPKKFLETPNKEKKRNYLDTCLKQRWKFNPFVASVDGLLGVEAEVTLKRITICLATKWK